MWSDILERCFGTNPTALPDAHAPPNDDAASLSSSVAPPISEKARGKRRMINVMAEVAESMQTPPPVETAAAPSPPPTTPPPENPFEDPARKRWEARELRNEQEYGELLDSILL
jgi:hypothetical protein